MDPRRDLDRRARRGRHRERVIENSGHRGGHGVSVGGSSRLRNGDAFGEGCTAFVQRNIVGESPRDVKRVWYRDRSSQVRTVQRCLLKPRPRRAKPEAARRRGPAQSAPAAATYSISELAQEFALTTRAIRFYEDEGLLAPQRRGQTRVYGERERTRIKLILRGKRLGLALSEIRELFDIYAAARQRAAAARKFVQMLADRRAMLLQQREDIDAVLAEIDALERDCRRRLKPARGAG